MSSRLVVFLILVFVIMTVLIAILVLFIGTQVLIAVVNGFARSV